MVLAAVSLWHIACSTNPGSGGIFRSKRAVFDLIPVTGQGQALQRRSFRFWSEIETRRSEERRREEMRSRRQKLKFLFKQAMKRQSRSKAMMPLHFFG